MPAQGLGQSYVILHLQVAACNITTCPVASEFSKKWQADEQLRKCWWGK